MGAGCEDLNSFSADCLDLLKRMLQWHPEDRITIPDILGHPFILQSYRHYPVMQEEDVVANDSQLPLKMKRYVEAPLLCQIGLKCLVHLASATVLPDDLKKELRTARIIFRLLDKRGYGQVSANSLTERLRQEGVAI